MTPADRQKYQDAILDIVKDGYGYRNLDLCVELNRKGLSTLRGSRTIDKVLQSMRKKGFIYFESGRWKLLTKPAVDEPDAAA